MTWTTQNPPPIQDPYDFGDKDLEQIAANIAAIGNTGGKKYFTDKQDFTTALPSQQFQLVDPLNIEKYGAFRVGFVFAKTFTVNALSELIIEDSTNTYIFYKALLKDIVKYNSDGTVQAFLTPSFGLAQVNSSRVIVRFTNLNPASSVKGLISANTDLIAADNKGTFEKLQGNNTLSHLVQAATPAALQTALNSHYQNIVGTGRVINTSYSISPIIGDTTPYSAIITYTKA